MPRPSLRRALHTLRQWQLVGRPSSGDALLCGDAPARRPRLARHGQIWPWLAAQGANQPGFRLLEIGSREVASASKWKQFVPQCDYTGLDVHPGRNVTHVGDAHQLAELFPAGSFDAVISMAVFEHLAMPWLVAEGIAQVLKPGGLVCIETHFSFSEHELPWHFFQFNSRGLEALFNPSLGFDVIDAGLDNPLVGRFAHTASPYLRGRPVGGLYCHAALLARKQRTVPLANAQLWQQAYRELSGASSYPEGTGLANSDASVGDTR